jgi:hypothetical protein
MYADSVQKLCAGIGHMSGRLDAFEQRERERARDARRRARADIEASLPDPDDPDAHDPRLEKPNEDPEDYSPHGYDGAADTSTGVLPPGTELPPSTGPYAVWNPRELKNPQESPPTPAAIGGP